MKHFKSAHHAAAASMIATITLTLGQAANAVGLAVTAAKLKPDDDVMFKVHLGTAITNIGEHRKKVESIFSKFRQDGGPTEAKNVDHVIEQLINAGFVRSDSPAVDVVMTQGLDAAFSKLDTLASAAADKIDWARQNYVADGTNKYLGYTTPVQVMTDGVVSFARDLELVISATWSDHMKQPSFIVDNNKPVTMTGQHEELVAA